MASFSLPILVVFGERLFQFTMSRRLMTFRSSRVSNDGLVVLKNLWFCPSGGIDKFHATRFVLSPPLGVVPVRGC